MIRYYPQLALLGLAVPALASVATPSAANSITDQLQLSSGGTTITITDNGAGDVNPIQGTINYVNSNFDGWEIGLLAYTNSPDLGLGLTSLTANCVGWQCSTDPLSIAFGDINFAVPSNLTIKGFEQVLKKAAAAGIAVNFSSGDGGDEGTGVPNGGGALYPSTSAFATAIGGTAIGIPNGTASGAEVGWGNNVTFLSFAQNAVLDPPEALGFNGGAGGGISTFIAKPSWQKSLPGTARSVPDISALADPFTGAVFTEFGQAEAGIGGTSLACPIFSAFWAIADQKAGKSLGQAAPLLTKLPAGSIHDVVPVSSPTNVAGIVFDSGGATFYSSDTLLAPLFTTTKYVSAAWDLGGGEFVDLSFATDTSLTVTPGWDNVTGWGVPNGLTFINAAAKAK